MLLSRYSISIATRFAVVMYCCCPDMNTLILWQQQNYYIRIYMSLYKYVMLLLRHCCCNICTLQNRKYSNVNVVTFLCRWYDLIRYSCYMYEKQYHCFNNTKNMYMSECILYRCAVDFEHRVWILEVLESVSKVK